MNVKNLKKGFTLTELIIVIVIIGILVGILVPTFVSVIRKANKSADLSLVRNLNDSLALDGIENGRHNNMSEAVEAAKQYGFDIEKISSKVSKNAILWDSKNDVFCYLDEDNIEYYPDSIPKKDQLEAGDYNLWIISDKPHASYSTYYIGNKESETVRNVGFDAGNSEIKDIKYVGTKGNSVIIRTNNVFGSLTIDAKNDEVSHYGDIGDLDIIAVKKASYNEYGRVGGIAKLTYGSFNVKDGAQVTTIVSNPVNIIDVQLSVEDHGVVGALLSENGNVITALLRNNSDKISYTEVIAEGNTDEVLSSVAYILHSDETRTYYGTFEEACNAVESGETVVVLRDYQYSSKITSTLVTIDTGKTVTLDLNGKIIQPILDNTESITVFSVKGDLTIIDSSAGSTGYGTGAIETSVAYAVDPWKVSAAVVKTQEGGKFTLASGKLINNGGRGSYVIDTYQGSTTIIEGGYIEATNYIGIRMFCNSTTKVDKLIVSGGTFNSKYANIWVQNPNASANKSDLIVSGGKFNSTDSIGNIDVSFEYSNYYNYTEMIINITGGTYNKGIYLEYDFWNNANGNAGTYTIAETLQDLVVYGTEDWKE